MLPGMKISYLFVAMAGLLVSTLLSAKEMPQVPPQEAGMSLEKLAAVDAKIEQMIADKKMAGCVVAVARRGKMVYFKPFGMADTATETPMRKDTIFRIFSMTKAVTTAAALMLVEEGKVALDDPVSKHLPQLKGLEVYDEAGNRKADPEMTVRDLIRHTSGLSYGWSANAVDKLYAEKAVLGGSLGEMVDRLAEIPLSFQPGTAWQYGVSSDVLGRLVEVVAGKPLDAFFAERIFKPLDMTDTGFQLPADKVGHFSANYSPQLAVIEKPSESKYLREPKMLSGGGGLLSTARDYMRFLQMIANGGELDGKRLLKPETVRLMTTNQLPESIKNIAIGLPRPGIGFGLGFSVCYKKTLFDPGAVVGEFGWGGAASTHYWVSPKHELVVVAMQQQMPFSFALEFGIKKLIYEAVEK